MPIRKPRLTRAEEAEYRVYLKQLQAEGIDVEIPEERQEARRDLQIDVGAPWENTVSEVRGGGIGYYAIYVRLIALRSGLILPETEISNAWDPQIQIESLTGENPPYDFGGLCFPRDQVLNERILNGLRFHARGDMVEGWILASGSAPIPECPEGAPAPFLLQFFDQFGHEFGEEGYVSVLRSTRREGATKQESASKQESAPEPRQSVLYAGGAPEPRVVFRGPGESDSQAMSRSGASSSGEAVEPRTDIVAPVTSASSAAASEDAATKTEGA